MSPPAAHELHEAGSLFVRPVCYAFCPIAGTGFPLCAAHFTPSIFSSKNSSPCVLRNLGVNESFCPGVAQHTGGSP